MVVPFLREDGTTRTSGTSKAVGMIKRGNPVPYGEFVGATATTPQSSATGTTSSIGAGNHLIITAAGMRNAAASDITNLTWVNPVGNTVFVNGTGDGRSLGMGFGQDTATGTKSNTASWANSGTTCPAISSILVFTVTG